MLILNQIVYERKKGAKVVILGKMMIIFIKKNPEWNSF